ncbi:U3 small nucleolar RNA-associated protein 14 [Ceratobasidium sp. AG-Ba]|nr:U3 small nucleolar RNA-associated protein 14 [Ceratobasidium sp. AG-Ba]
MAPRPARTKKPNAKVKAARANIRGYAARQARKAASSSGNSLDVYEYSANKVRRAGIPLTLDREEEVGAGKADDGDDELNEVREKLRRHIANGEEEGVVLDDDDEEIDSDAAFEDESDEERFASFKFRESKPKGSKSKGKGKEKEDGRKPAVSFAVDVDLNEDEDSQEDDGPTPRPVGSNSDSASGSDGEDDGDDEDEEDEDDDGEPGTMIDLSNMLDQPQSESESDDASESEHESDAPSIASDVDADPDASSKLVSFISTLDTSSKKRKQDDSDQSPKKKRALVQDRTEAGPEGEFGARSGAQPLTLTDLLEPAPQLSKSTKPLQSTTKSVLSAPLAQRTQDRIDREAAYEATKQEIQKWAPTMKRIRESEHLAFPLQGPGAEKKGISNADIIGRFRPTTPMESAISSLLRAAHLSTDAETAVTENTLVAAKLTPEDLAARRAQLRMTRELMFRADVKAKRVAKIKSRAYRKMKKREKEKLAAAGLDLEEGDKDDDEEEKARQRAKERATLRHRTTGKWAQAMRRKGEMGEEETEAMHSLVDRSEVLRRKIAGEDGSSDEDEEGGEERDMRELEELGTMDDVPTAAKGIMGMKFMRDAVARGEREAASMADETRLELLGMERDSVDDIGDEVVGGNLGRRVYKPGQVKPAQTYSDISSTLKDSESTNSPTDTITPLPAASASQSPSLTPTSTFLPATTSSGPSSNPWLSVGSTSITGKIARKSNAVETTKVQKLQAKSETERSKAREDAVVEIDMTQAMTLSDAQVDQRKTKQKGPKETPSAKVDSAYQDSEDEGSEMDECAPTAFKQRELVAMAFAGDNVVEDFAVEKQRVIEEDAPKEVDTTLPGWGSWGGRGTKRSAPRPSLVKKIPGVDATKRTDAGKSHVIISERKDKKAAKYLVKDLPYPYTSKEQFARSMATPIGAEWNTRVAHQRATLPRVVKKRRLAVDENFVADGFTRPYVGPAADLLFCYLKELDEVFSTGPREYYAKMCSIFQSSGVGKSRAILQLKEHNVIVVYMNIRDHGRSEDGAPRPPRDVIPADILTKKLECSEDEYSDRCIAFLIGLFMVLAKRLEAYSVQYHSRDQIARAWSNDMCELKDNVQRTRFFVELKRCYKAVSTAHFTSAVVDSNYTCKGGGTSTVTSAPPFLDLVSFVLISDKAKKRGSGFTLDTDWLEWAKLPQLDQPYVAIVADLGLNSQEAVFTLESSLANPVLKIHASGLGRTTYPYLTEQLIEPLREILAEPIIEQPNQGTYTEACKRLNKQLRYGSSSKNADIVWENNKWSFSM